MEMLLVIGMVACGWVFLCVLTGEHSRLRQELDVKLPPADPNAANAVEPENVHRPAIAGKVSSKAGHAER